MVGYSRVLFYPSLYFLGVIATPYSPKKDVVYAGKLLLNAIDVAHRLENKTTLLEKNIENLVE